MLRKDIGQRELIAARVRLGRLARALLAVSLFIVVCHSVLHEVGRCVQTKPFDFEQGACQTTHSTEDARR